MTEDEICEMFFELDDCFKWAMRWLTGGRLWGGLAGGDDVVLIKFDKEEDADLFDLDAINMQEGRKKRVCRCGECMHAARRRQGPL